MPTTIQRAHASDLIEQAIGEGYDDEGLLAGWMHHYAGAPVEAPAFHRLQAVIDAHASLQEARQAAGGTSRSTFADGDLQRALDDFTTAADAAYPMQLTAAPDPHQEV